jgi:hypothetical protein
MAENGNSDVAKQSDAVAGMAEAWSLIADLSGGTTAMRRAGQRHLPQWPAEDADSYKSRLSTVTLFLAYARTISVLTGRPFSKPITVGEDVPPQIANGWKTSTSKAATCMPSQPICSATRSATDSAASSWTDPIITPCSRDDNTAARCSASAIILTWQMT